MRTIEFFSTVDGLADACPIIPAKDYTAKWMAAARQDYIEELKMQTGKWSHIYQCPGIFDLFNHGYIIPMWHDVSIKTNGNATGFSYLMPTDSLEKIIPSNPVGKHIDGLDKFIPSRPWSLNNVIKLNTPWNVIAPKGIKFLLIPISYPDSFEFEAAPGILDPGYSSEINLQIHWNILNGEYVLKAGTPMAHLIPLSEENFNMVCRTMNEHDKKWIHKRTFFNHFTFKLKRNLIKEVYYKHFRK